MLKHKFLFSKFGLLIVAALVVFISGCNRDEFIKNVSIGEAFQGGVVAHIFQPGDPMFVDGKISGIIIAPEDKVFTSQWGCQGTAVRGTSTAVGAGRKNTELVLAFHDMLPDFYNKPTQCHPANNGSVAARVTLDFNVGGYTDWFMPSLKEMNLLYDNRDLIGGFSSLEYWSSCESNSTNACVMSFVTGEQVSKPKSEEKRVRVIRFF